MLLKDQAKSTANKVEFVSDEEKNILAVNRTFTQRLVCWFKTARETRPCCTKSNA